MSGDQLGNLGAGAVFSLAIIRAPVNVGRPGTDACGVGIGSNPNSPIGPKVIVAVTGKLPGEDARCASAHITAEQAIALASELLEAAAVIAPLEVRMQ